MSYNLTRRKFIKQASTIVLTVSALALAGCGPTSGGQISGSTDENGEKVIINEIKTSVGKQTRGDDNYSYLIEDVFKNETAEGNAEYGCHMWVSARDGIIYDNADSFVLYVDGQKLDDVTVEGAGMFPPSTSSYVTVKGPAPATGRLLKIVITVSDYAFRGDGIQGTIREKTIVSCETSV